MTRDDAQCEISSMLATLASYEGMFGPYHLQTLSVKTSLAMALCESGRALEGRRLLERAAEDLTKYYDKHHPLRIRALEAWAGFLCRQADWRAALPVQQELLECRTHLLGADHPDSLAARSNLAATMLALTEGSWAISA